MSGVAVYLVNENLSVFSSIFFCYTAKKNLYTSEIRVKILFKISQLKIKSKQNDKPGYVVDVHLSSSVVASRLKRPT